MTTMETLRTTVAALMYATGESQGELGYRLGLTQSQISRRQAGRAVWSLDDVDALSAHYGIPVPDLVAGADAALRKLPAARRAEAVGGHQTTVPVI
jgi:transcriptional regulator with XRE-family HTH domain